MVIDYAVGEYTVNGENASVQVSAKLTRPDGKLVVQENVPYSMTRQDVGFTHLHKTMDTPINHWIYYSFCYPNDTVRHRFVITNNKYF